MHSAPDHPDQLLGSVLDEVANAVGLAEGPAGVRGVLREIARHEPVSVRDVSRAVGLPVPIVAAVCNELRTRGWVAEERPVQLTAHGRTTLSATSGEVDVRCERCGGSGLQTPRSLAGLVSKLVALEAATPAARMDLDQAHCTADTKVRRVLAMHEAGALRGRIVIVGDDDLTSVAIARAAATIGAAASIEEVVVLEIDPALVEFLRGELAEAPFATRVVEHDLRDPVPDDLRGTAASVFTDPPYTVDGASLFLSRAVEAANDEADVFFAFGSKPPAETLAVQQAMSSLGLVVQRLVPGFNEYHGAGILGGTSALYHLRRAAPAAEMLAPARYDGPMYTADERERRARRYTCTTCGNEVLVGFGPGAAHETIAALKASGCERCQGSTFRPGQLAGA